MEKEKIKVGGIYRMKQNGEMVFVLLFDEVETLYTTIKEEENPIYKILKKKIFFFRLPTSFFIKNAEFVKNRQLSKEEFNVFRPDLPLRFLRIKNLNIDNLCELDIKEKIDSCGIYLAPTTKRKAIKKPFFIKSEKGFFTSKEILNYAINAKLQFYNKISGIGIFRLGIQNGYPLYYIGDYYDLAGYLK